MHEDYLALKREPRARLRYLLTLLAKDLSQHAHRVPGAVEASEDVVAILALAERNLRGARGGGPIVMRGQTFSPNSLRMSGPNELRGMPVRGPSARLLPKWECSRFSSACG